MPSTNIFLPVALSAAALALAACATAQDAPPKDSPAAGMMAGADTQRMCEMYRQMTAGKSPDEQRAAVGAHMRSMHGTVTPEMVNQHLRMMQAKCATAPPRTQ